mgnify:CR=1 FL=1
MPRQKKKSQSTQEDTLMTLSDVAVFLQVAERTVYQWAQRGQIPSFKLGNVWRFKRSDLHRWIEDCRQETPRTKIDA